jgi:hypothetical protein
MSFFKGTKVESLGQTDSGVVRSCLNPEFKAPPQNATPTLEQMNAQKLDSSLRGTDDLWLGGVC